MSCVKQKLLSFILVSFSMLLLSCVSNELSNKKTNTYNDSNSSQIANNLNSYSFNLDSLKNYTQIIEDSLIVFLDLDSIDTQHLPLQIKTLSSRSNNLDTLMQVYKNSNDSLVRFQILLSLSLKNDLSTDYKLKQLNLYNLALNDTWFWNQIWALKGLKKLDFKSSQKTVISFFDNPNKLIEIQAINTFASMGGSDKNIVKANTAPRDVFSLKMYWLRWWKEKKILESR